MSPLQILDIAIALFALAFGIGGLIWALNMRSSSR